MDEQSKVKKTGTTIVGILCNDGVILASETRATIAIGYVIHEEEEKIYKVDDHIGMMGAGAGADVLALVHMLQVEARLFKKRHERPISVEAAVSLISNILYQYKMMPFMAGWIFAGVEADGKPRLFLLDPYGAVAELSDYTAYAGSGWFTAQAVLDVEYEKKSVKELLPLAVKAVKAAIRRDTASGGKITVATITKDGFKLLKKEEVDKIAEKLEKGKEKKEK